MDAYPVIHEPGKRIDHDGGVFVDTAPQRRSPVREEMIRIVGAAPEEAYA